MAGSARLTYRPIPPPPLPEFYLRKPADKLSSTSTSTFSNDAACLPMQPRQQPLPPARYLPPAPTDGDAGGPVYKTYTYATATNLPPARMMDPVPPLAVYHICRICVCPRSAHYHHDHPIPIDGVPPPPGICRRCRVSSVSGSKITTAEVQESAEVKLGVKCLVPDNNYVSAEVLHSRATERFMQERDCMELKSASEREGDVIYRRARASAPQKETLKYTYRPAQMMVPPPPPSYAPRRTTSTLSVPTNVIDSNATTMGQSSLSRLESPGLAGPMPTRNGSPSGLKRGDSVQEVTKTRRSTRSRHSNHRTSIHIEAFKPERTEVEIRRLARDEVIRYSQAERMMEAHGDVYAHGKFVEAEEAPAPEPTSIVPIPVERRIALVKDFVDRPWIKSPERPRTLDFATQTDDGQQLEGIERRWRHLSADDRLKLETKRRAHIRQDLLRCIREEKAKLRQDVTASEKTRWPGSDETRRAKVAENSTRYDVEEVEEDVKGAAVDRHFEDAERRSAKFVESMRNMRDPRSHTRGRQADALSSSSDGWTDREYWLDGQPTGAVVGSPSKTAKTRGEQPSTTARIPRLVTQHQPIAGEATPRERVVANIARPTRHRHEKRTATDALPYPAEESIVSAQMPSPRPHISKAKQSQPQDPKEGEYTYVKRTVQHSRASSRPAHEKPYYEVQETFGRRSKPAQDQVKPPEQVEVITQHQDSKQRASDVSSRVRFSKQVEFSPTPPGSEASSTQFRRLGRMRRDLGRGETGGDLIAEYERRGRARSRLPYEGYDYR